MIEQLLQTALDEIQAGHPVMLVSVVRSTGSTPRAAGALLLAGENGLLCGTVGGGLAEYEVCQTAERLGRTRTPCLLTFDMKNGEAGRSGMICGGEIDVLFEVVG